MSWNHRILVTLESSGEIYLEICEVYYDKKGNPKSHTAKGVSVGGDSVKSLKWVLDKMKKCCNKPILWGDHRFPEEYKEIT